MAPLWWLLGLGVAVLPILLHYVRCSHTGESKAKPHNWQTAFFVSGGGACCRCTCATSGGPCLQLGQSPFPSSAALIFVCLPPPPSFIIFSLYFHPFMVITYAVHPVEAFHELLRQHSLIYGPVYTFWLGMKP